MAETALNFGPEWLRVLSHGNSAPAPVSPEAPSQRYKLAQYRYGREEMLALFSKDLKPPEVLKHFDYLLTEKSQIPMALLPITEDEQRLWARSVNSDMALRVSGKAPPSGPGNGMVRGGRGGSVDRGRARGGRGGYYQRGLRFDDNDDGPPGGFTRLRTLERSHSVSEKDQRWSDRDRYERNAEDGSIAHGKQESSRPPSDNWRRNDKEDDNGWRTSNSRPADKFAGRNTWRVPMERDRMKPEFDKDKGQFNREVISNGPGKHNSHHPRQRSNSGHQWDDDMTGDNLPEWSVEEPAITDVVGTFDSSGAFLETKVTESSFNSDDIYASDDEECIKKKESPGPKVDTKAKDDPVEVKLEEKPSINPPVERKKPEPGARDKDEVLNKTLEQSSKLLYIDKPVNPQGPLNAAPPTVKHSSNINSELSMRKETHGKSLVRESQMQSEDIPCPTEEDAFAHHKKATENMMAQWTEEDEQSVVSRVKDKHVLPVHHEDAQKWFYRDPQAEIQGPFTSAEMCDWFKAGYFSMDLLVRRGCDERFMQLGELIQTWGRMPFLPGTCPPPLRVTSAPVVPNPTPIVQAAVCKPASNPQSSAKLSHPDAQMRLLQQQMFQQFMQQQQHQMIIRQAHMQQLLVQLKQQESFAKLSTQQQMQAVQQLVAQHQQAQVPRPNVPSIPEQPVLEATPPVPFPLLGVPVPTVVKNDMSLWNIPPSSGTWPAGQSVSKPPDGSIWDGDKPVQLPVDKNELEKQKKLAAEEEEKRRKAEEAIKKLEEEKQRREEEEKKQKEEAERLLREIQQQQEEEKRRLEEMKRLKEEEEKRRIEELKRLEEIKKEEERRLEELRKQEERRLEELREEEKRLEELRKQEELRKLEEKKQAAEREEQRRKELKRREELQKQEEMKMKEQERLLEIERQKAAQKLKEQQAVELKLQKEAERQQELQRRQLAEKLKREAEAAQLEMQQKETESTYRQTEPKCPAWGVSRAEPVSGELSLTDIQKLQEQKEREEKERLKQQQQFHQQLLLQQQSLKQAQVNRNGLSWAKRPSDSSSTVKSLAEIQEEEALILAKQQQKVQKPAAPAVQAPAVSGVWGNSSQLSRITTPAAWNVSNSGFWDDALKSTAPAQKPTKNSDSAFPALSNSSKPAVPNNSRNRNIRAKKDEEAVMKIFEAHRKPTDEFTAWCTETISNLQSSVDVPTFVAFLKDIESPYEVFDYVKSYLGEGKEAREFGKQFLERRSKFRNQSKQAVTEEDMWGPAPAITPAAKPAAINDSDGTCTKGKAKKKKNRMQKLDSSMLGFTVQPNPDRINVGEIDRVEGM